MHTLLEQELSDRNYLWLTRVFSTCVEHQIDNEKQNLEESLSTICYRSLQATLYSKFIVSGTQESLQYQSELAKNIFEHFCDSLDRTTVYTSTQKIQLLTLLNTKPLENLNRVSNCSATLWEKFQAVIKGSTNVRTIRNTALNELLVHEQKAFILINGFVVKGSMENFLSPHESRMLSGTTLLLRAVFLALMNSGAFSGEEFLRELPFARDLQHIPVYSQLGRCWTTIKDMGTLHINLHISPYDATVPIQCQPVFSNKDEFFTYDWFSRRYLQLTGEVHNFMDKASNVLHVPPEIAYAKLFTDPFDRFNTYYIMRRLVNDYLGLQEDPKEFQYSPLFSSHESPFMNDFSNDFFPQIEGLLEEKINSFYPVPSSSPRSQLWLKLNKPRPNLKGKSSIDIHFKNLATAAASAVYHIFSSITIAWKPLHKYFALVKTPELVDYLIYVVHSTVENHKMISGRYYTPDGSPTPEASVSYKFIDNLTRHFLLTYIEVVNRQARQYSYNPDSKENEILKGYTTKNNLDKVSALLNKAHISFKNSRKDEAEPFQFDKVNNIAVLLYEKLCNQYELFSNVPDHIATVFMVAMIKKYNVIQEKVSIHVYEYMPSEKNLSVQTVPSHNTEEALYFKKVDTVNTLSSHRLEGPPYNASNSSGININVDFVDSVIDGKSASPEHDVVLVERIFSNNENPSVKRHSLNTLDLHLGFPNTRERRHNISVQPSSYQNNSAQRFSIGTQYAEMPDNLHVTSINQATIQLGVPALGKFVPNEGRPSNNGLPTSRYHPNREIYEDKGLDEENDTEENEEKEEPKEVKRGVLEFSTSTVDLNSSDTEIPDEERGNLSTLGFRLNNNKLPSQPSAKDKDKYSSVLFAFDVKADDLSPVKQHDYSFPHIKKQPSSASQASTMENSRNPNGYSSVASTKPSHYSNHAKNFSLPPSNIRTVLDDDNSDEDKQDYTSLVRNQYFRPKTQVGYGGRIVN